jgi:hypothetical protein
VGPLVHGDLPGDVLDQWAAEVDLTPAGHLAGLTCPADHVVGEALTGRSAKVELGLEILKVEGKVQDRGVTRRAVRRRLCVSACRFGDHVGQLGMIIGRLRAAVDGLMDESIVRHYGLLCRVGMRDCRSCDGMCVAKGTVAVPEIPSN